MKFLFLFFLLSVIALAFAHDRGCRRIDGTCIEDCKEGTHEYNSNCMAPTWSRKTCSDPVPHDIGALCDLSRCDCDDGTVLDETTKKCVKLEDCPK